MDVTSEDPHISVCMRSSKHFILWCDVEKDTPRCQPMMQNLQKLSLQYLIPDKAPLLCRIWRPRSLMCPIHMCQSLVVFFFSVIAKVSPIIALSIIFYKFANQSSLRIIIEPLITLIPPSIPENLHFWVFKAPNERRFFLKSRTSRTFMRVQTCPSNIFIQMLPMPTVLHTSLLPIRIEPLSKGLYILNHSLIGHMWYIHPESSNQSYEYFSFHD